jgi:GMP synthase-like glutamine amidotransferase
VPSRSRLVAWASAVSVTQRSYARPPNLSTPPWEDRHMGNDHVHNWHLDEVRELPDDPDATFKVERCSWCGERREYRNSGHYDHG